MNKEYFVKIARQDPKPRPGYICVGPGNERIPLNQALGISSLELFYESDGRLFGGPVVGIEPDWNYYISKEKWEKIFGDFSLQADENEQTIPAMNDEVKQKSLEVHQKRLQDEEIQKAANELFTAQVMLNEKKEQHSIAQEKLKDAARAMNHAEEAFKRFVENRDLETYKREVKQGE